MFVSKLKHKLKAFHNFAVGVMLIKTNIIWMLQLRARTYPNEREL